jgi:hypothetical protein
MTNHDSNKPYVVKNPYAPYYSELPPWLQPDPVNYGTPNIGYETINKHSEKISAFLFIFILVCSVITCKAFYEYGQENETISTRVNVSSTVVHHSSNDGFDFFNKRYEIDPKVKTLIDSMEQAEREKRLAMEAEEREKRKQFMRDSILAYVHMRDSIRHEILRQDSIRMELERQRKAQIEYIAVIDDGITKRTVNVNTVSDTLPENVTKQLGEAFETMTLEAVRERQKEIDRTKDYYKHLRLPTERIL